MWLTQKTEANRTRVSCVNIDSKKRETDTTQIEDTTIDRKDSESTTKKRKRRKKRIHLASTGNFCSNLQCT